MLRMCEPIFWAGKDVILGSGFCVAKGIVQLEAKGVDDRALIKKHCFWPWNVKCGAIDRYFVDKEVGDCGMLEAKADERGSFKIFCFEGPACGT